MAHTFDELILSDLHKDAYGYRPREWFWSQWGKYSDDDKQVVWDNLRRQCRDAHLPDDALTWGRGLVVEPRYDDNDGLAIDA